MILFKIFPNYAYHCVFLIRTSEKAIPAVAELKSILPLDTAELF